MFFVLLNATHLLTRTKWSRGNIWRNIQKHFHTDDLIKSTKSTLDLDSLILDCDWFFILWIPIAVWDQFRCWETAHPPLPKANINTYFLLRAKWWLRGGVGGQFPRNLNWFAVCYKIRDDAGNCLSSVKL